DLADDLGLADDAALDEALEATNNLDDLAANLEVDDDLAIGDDLALAGSGDELVGLDDLDQIDLGDIGGDDLDEEATLGDLDAAPPTSSQAGTDAFAEGEIAVDESRWNDAIAHLETAYESGVDIAELHTLLAWSRFKASGEAFDMGTHALELLAYAEEMNPALAMIYAYRSAVLLAQGDNGGA
ncbi:MAG: hypothetical protein KC457_37130, partial [Myxococcales bacterium]|nr:hypothetical protein [Myxococcales bacterium]